MNGQAARYKVGGRFHVLVERMDGWSPACGNLIATHREPSETRRVSDVEGWRRCGVEACRRRWPGESEAQFGYSVGNDGAEIKVEQDGGQDCGIPRLPWDG